MIKQIKIIRLLFFGLLMTFLSSCHRINTPKPYGYFRIALPDTGYHPYIGSTPYCFDLSKNAQLTLHTSPEEANWVDIVYPSLHTTLYGSYFPIKDNLDLLTQDAVKMVYKHVGQATAIPEQSFVNEESHVYGVLFTLKGNTASPYQFFLTDSVKHFFRASVYCDCRPNADSLAPVYTYLEQDIRRMIETWKWDK